MSGEFVCHNCGRELKVHEKAIGRRVRCPGCETLVVVPEPEPAEMEAEEELAGDAGAKQPSEDPHPSPLPEGEGTVGSELHATEAWKPPQEPPRVAAPPPPANLTPPPIAAAARPKPKPAEEPPLVLPPQSHQEDLIDMTAMVDIVFFLLIFFMVTSLQAIEAVMNLPTPQSAEGGVSTSRSVADLENDPSYITVRIEDDDSIWVEDTQVFNDQELARRLRTARKESDGPRSLLVIGDADASHGSAVRVFDAGAGAGVNSISLIVQEKGEGSR